MEILVLVLKALACMFVLYGGVLVLRYGFGQSAAARAAPQMPAGEVIPLRPGVAGPAVVPVIDKKAA